MNIQSMPQRDINREINGAVNVAQDDENNLNQEEQDIAIDIRNTPVDSALIVQSIARTIFGEVYPYNKFKIGKYDFHYDQYVDEITYDTASGGIRLHFVTIACDYHDVAKVKLMMDSQINNEAIILLSNEIPYFEELEQAAKIRKCFIGKNVQQLSESKQAIIREWHNQAEKLEKNAKALIEKAILNGTFYIYGEVVELKSNDAKSKIDAALTHLIKCVYSKLSHVTLSYESDADVLQILNGEAEQVGIIGTGANNEYALNEISQWLELQAGNHVPVSMGDVQRKFKAIPYGWREVDIAALVAHLIVGQKIAIRYDGATVAKDERRLVDYLRLKSERDKASVTRRIAPSEELMQKSVAFLCDWLGQTDIPSDEDRLIAFVIDTFDGRKRHYQNLLDKEYSIDSYPQKEVVTTARDLMNDILSQARDNFALLNRLVARQDDLRSSTEDMEAVETFFNPKSLQKVIFDIARRLEKDFQDGRGYFETDSDTNRKMGEIKAILALPKPYGRIKDLDDLTQSVRNAYGALLELKKEEVQGMVVQCMGDVHTLAGVGFASDVARKADARFMDFKQKAINAESLTLLDAMITQLLNFKDIICRQIEAMQHRSGVVQDGGNAKHRSMVQLRRYDVFPVRRLQSHEDVDNYLENIRKMLYGTLDDNDGIQIM